MTQQLPPDGVERLIGAARLPDPLTLQPDLPPHLAALIIQAMAVKQEDRFESAAAMRAALHNPHFRLVQPAAMLEATLAARPEPTQPARPEPTQPRPRRRGWGCVATLMMLALLLALGLAGAVAWVLSDIPRLTGWLQDPALNTQVAVYATQAEQAGLTTPVVALLTQVAQSPLGTAIAQVNTQAYGGLTPVLVTATLVDPATQPPVNLTPVATPATPTPATPVTPTSTPQPVSPANAAFWRTYVTWSPPTSAALFALSPAGDAVAFPSRQGVDIFDLTTGTVITELQGFVLGEPVLAVGYLTDTLLVQLPSEILRWSIANNTQVGRPIRVAGRDLRVSPDRRFFAVRDRYLSVYRVSDNQRIIDGVGADGASPEFAFSPDGRWLALEKGVDAELYNLATGRRERTLSGHGEPTLGLAFSQDSTRLYSAGGDVWDVTTGQRLFTFDSASTRLALDPTGQVLVGDDGLVWEAATGQRLGVFAPATRADQLAFGAGGLVLVRQASRGTVELWTVDPNATPPPTRAAVPTPTSAPFDTLNMARWQSQALPLQGVRGLAFSPSQTLALAWLNTQVLVVDPASQNVLATLEAGGSVNEAVFLGEGFVLALVNGSRVLRWDVTTGRLMQDYAYAGTRLRASPDGRRFAVLSEFVQVVDTLTERLLRQLGNRNDPQQDFVFSPDSQLLALAGQSNVAVFEMSNFRQVGTLGVRGGRARGLMFSPDGQTLLSAAGDVWDMRRRAAQSVVTFNSPRATHLARNADGTLLVGNTGELWDATSGQFLGTLPFNVRQVLFLPDARTLLALNASGALAAWRVAAPVAYVPPTPQANVPAAPAVQTLLTTNVTSLSLSRWWRTDPVLTVRLERDATQWQARALGPQTINRLTLSHDGLNLTLRTPDGIEVLDPRTGQVVHRYTPFLNPEAITEAAWLGEQDLLLLKPNSGLERWNLAAQTLTQRYNLTGQGLIASPDGRFFALRVDDLTVRVLETASGRTVLQTRAGRGAQMYAFDPASPALAVANGLFVERFDLTTGRRVAQLRASTPSVFGLTFTRDGRLIAASGSIWDWSSGQLVLTLGRGAALGAVPPRWRVVYPR